MKLMMNIHASTKKNTHHQIHRATNKIIIKMKRSKFAEQLRESFTMLLPTLLIIDNGIQMELNPSCKLRWRGKEAIGQAATKVYCVVNIINWHESRIHCNVKNIALHTITRSKWMNVRATIWQFASSLFDPCSILQHSHTPGITLLFYYI